MSSYDDELLSSFLHGRSRILRFLRGKTGSQQDAEDLAQEAWIKLSRNGDAAADAPIAYLTRIARSLAIDHSRTRGRALTSGEVADLLDVADEAPARSASSKTASRCSC